MTYRIRRSASARRSFKTSISDARRDANVRPAVCRSRSLASRTVGPEATMQLRHVLLATIKSRHNDIPHDTRHAHAGWCDYNRDDRPTGLYRPHGHRKLLASLQFDVTCCTFIYVCERRSSSVKSLERLNCRNLLFRPLPSQCSRNGSTNIHDTGIKGFA